MSALRYIFFLLFALALVWVIEYLQARVREIDERALIDRGCKLVGRTQDEKAVWQCRDGGE